MKIIFFFLLVWISFSGVSAQTVNPAYDAALADSLGADEFGMKKYIMVFLRSGTYIPENSVVSDSLFRGHMNNIMKLVDEGKLVVAGPFGENNDELRGIFILNTDDLNAAEEMLKGDDAISSGVFIVQMVPWYGSAALPLYLDESEKIWKVNP